MVNKDLIVSVNENSDIFLGAKTLNVSQTCEIKPKPQLTALEKSLGKINIHQQKVNRSFEYLSKTYKNFDQLFDPSFVAEFTKLMHSHDSAKNSLKFPRGMLLDIKTMETNMSADSFIQQNTTLNMLTPYEIIEIVLRINKIPDTWTFAPYLDCLVGINSNKKSYIIEGKVIPANSRFIVLEKFYKRN